MVCRSICAIIVCCCLVITTLAQQPPLYFERLTTQNGLSHNKVNCFLQDRRGFMWIGTEDGLNRYDGHSFVVFRNQPGNPASISGNIITDLLEDEAQVIWIATADGGLTRYDHRLPPEAQFRQYRHLEADTASIPTNIVNTLLQDPQGYLWLGTGGKGVWRFNKRTERFEQPVKEGTQGILDLCLDKTGIIWAGRQGGGLLQIDARRLTYRADKRYADLYAQLPHVTVTALFCDSRRHMWYGSWDKVLYRYNALTGQEEVFRENGRPYSFANDEITSFAEDGNGLLWMGGSRHGLQVYDPQQDRFYHYRHDASMEGTIAADRINCIYKDRQGVMWIGTGKGISLHHPVQQQFEQVFLPPVPGGNKRATIYDFFFDSNKNLWIGTSNGIYIYQPAAGAFRHLPLQYKGHPLSVSKFFKDVDGTLYLGTDYSLFRFNPATGRLSLLPNTERDPVMNKIIASRVVCVARDTIAGHPVLLAVPYGHFLAYYDLVEQRWISRRDSVRNILRRYNLKDNLIRKIFRDSNGKIWLATARYGLGEWTRRPLPYVNYLPSNPKAAGAISNDHVYDMMEDARGNLWVSTYGGGLNYFETATRKFFHIPATANLLEGIQADDSGHVWMISNGDLHRYDPYKRIYHSYKLPDLEKSGGISGNIFKSPDGKMYVGGAGYFIGFHPDAIVNEQGQPRIFFTDFRIFNTSFSHLLGKNKITLRYNQNYFRIEFAAPLFAAARHVRYAYQLQGWNRGWIENGDQHFAQFSNLPGGEYLFKVRAANGPGAWSREEASIRIVIVPPFWKQWWFYALLVLLLLGATYSIYRYRVNELLKREAIRNKIAQDLHDNVGAALSSIAVYSQVAKIYSQQRKEEELNGTIDKINDTADDMISEMNDIVWAINPRNDNMSTMLQRMESFARPLLAAKGIAFHFEVDEQVKHINLEMTRRKNLYLIFKEAVSNALKYADCRQLWVRISFRHHGLELTVKDDGKGFDLEKVQIHASRSLSGNGLRNMEMRAAEMKGALVISSGPGKGTTIQLRIKN